MNGGLRQAERRKSENHEGSINHFVFRFADMEVHEGEFFLLRNGQKLSIEPKPFRVLLFLLQNPRKVVPKRELMDSVWADVDVTEHSLTRAVALLRRALEDDARNPRFIETVNTIGYRFLAPVHAHQQHEILSEHPAPASNQGDTFPCRPAPESRPARTSTSDFWVAIGIALTSAIGVVWQLYLGRP